MGMKKLFILQFSACLVGLSLVFAWAAEKKLGSISGQVVLVKTTSGQVLVAHKKPAALIETISTFKVDGKTQLKNVNNIASLKINDTVSVTYVESETGDLLAQAVERQQPTPASGT